jgi:hypothetical protein
MKKHFIVFLSVVIVSAMAFAKVSNAQSGIGIPRGGGELITPTSPNALYVEVFGNAVLYSINYDRFITPHREHPDWL